MKMYVVAEYFIGDARMWPHQIVRAVAGGPSRDHFARRRWRLRRVCRGYHHFKAIGFLVQHQPNSLLEVFAVAFGEFSGPGMIKAVLVEAAVRGFTERRHHLEDLLDAEENGMNHESQGHEKKLLKVPMLEGRIDQDALHKLVGFSWSLVSLHPRGSREPSIHWTASSS